jgi:hypothetical protein
LLQIVLHVQCVYRMNVVADILIDIYLRQILAGAPRT